MKYRTLKIALILFIANCQLQTATAWGFFAHKKINHLAVFLLPPEMMRFYKPNIEFITDHAVDPDKRRYSVANEGQRHYIDIDFYGQYPFANLPHNWDSATAKFTEDTIRAEGIVPWWVQTMERRLTQAFKEKNQLKILKFSAEIGHYIADAHVPLHASGNHDGQLTEQKGIHAFWESRLPELFADEQWDFFIGKAEYIERPDKFIWERVLESGAAADTVLKFEALLNKEFPSDKKYAFEERSGKLIKQYSSAYSAKYQEKLQGMVERRMRQSIYAVASFWYTAWVNAGQPDLSNMMNTELTEADKKEFEELNEKWAAGKSLEGREL
jgi:hypothetical protein